MKVIDKSVKIYIAGHRGMVGSACVRKLRSSGYHNIIVKSSSELDLRNQKDVNDFISIEKPYLVIICAARVGGILANSSSPFEFLMDNLQIQNSLISACHSHDVQKVIFLGSSCIYPKFALQPLKEEYLLTGKLEETNEWYAIAKIAGLKAIEALRIQYNRNYFSLMPTNLYGPNDNYNLDTSHVLPAVLRKFHNAKIKGIDSVNLWGSGKPLREFLHVDDLASAVQFSLENQIDYSVMNVGSGDEISIKNLAEMIQHIVGYNGEIIWDDTKPDGTPRKLLDSSKIENLGWKPRISLRHGIKELYADLVQNEWI